MIFNNLNNCVNYIESQLISETNYFKRDPQVEEIARREFNGNFNYAIRQSNLSAFCGVVSLMTFSCSLSLPTAPFLGLVSASVTLSQIWKKYYYRERQFLQNAVAADDENAIIYQLSLGADISQPIWPTGWIRTNRFEYFLMGGCPRSPVQWFTEKECYKVVAYLAILQFDDLARSDAMTKALTRAKDKKMLQLLVNFGGDILSKREELLNTKHAKSNQQLINYILS